MKTYSKVAGSLALAGMIISCSTASRNNKAYAEKDKDVMITSPPPVSPGSPNQLQSSGSATYGWSNNQNIQPVMMSSSAAEADDRDTLRRFIRTAELRFRAKDVIKSTYTIEDIVRHFGGIVTYTDLRSNVDQVTNVPVSADSSLETTYYTMVNNITIRVPNHQLDTTLKCFAPLVDFMDYRIIKADNVRFRIIEHLLEEARLAKHNERLSKEVDATKGSKKIEETTEAENDLLAKDEQKDNATIGNLKIEDSIKYSTISLSIYQRQTIKRELLLNAKNTTAYEPGFWHKLKDAIKDGWDSLMDIILGLMHAWTILLILGAGIYFVYRKWFKKL